MLSHKEKERPSLRYLHMDALNTTFQDQEFSVVLDKGTLDALMPDDSAESVKTVTQYFEEIQRVLRSMGGRYVCISLLQDHILQKLLDYFPSNNWMFRAVRCFESEIKSIENGENAMPVFMVVCTKFKTLPRQVLEVNLGAEDKMHKCDSIKEVVAQISSSQRAAFICSALQKVNIGDDNEIAMDLYSQDDQKQARYSIYIAEIEPRASNGAYAVFVVPEGR